MCTLAVYRRTSATYPLIVVANRDEFLGRESEPPFLWPGDGPIVAGRDLVAGGTWLGCRLDGSGRVVGVLNRRPDANRPASGPGELSRGSLCIDALRAPSIASYLPKLTDAVTARYGGFNLFVADLEEAFVLDNGDGARRVDLGWGLSVLTNLDVNDPRCPRLAGATKRFQALEPMLSDATAEQAVVALTAVLASHEDGIAPSEEASAFSRICVHAPSYGTRSSSILFVNEQGRVRYFHADGAPCEATMQEVRADVATPSRRA